MQKIMAILVPYELGRYREGVGCGPEHLMEHGALAALGSRGGETSSRTVKLDERFASTGYGEADAAFELIRIVAGETRLAVTSGAFPVVFSGSCFPAIGLIAGLDEARPAVVWFDAHSDFSEPGTTTSGYLDSMGLSILTGSAWQAMLATVASARPVPESSVILAGARAFDESEAERLKASAIRQLPPESLRTSQLLVEAVNAMTPEITGVYIHIDLDVLSADIARVNVFSEPGGLNAEDLGAHVTALMRSLPVRAISFAAYEPERDIENRVPGIVASLLERIATVLAERDS